MNVHSVCYGTTQPIEILANGGKSPSLERCEVFGNNGDDFGG